jgi:hypothetical protein
MRGISGSLLAVAGALFIILSPTSAIGFGLAELGLGPVVLTPSFKTGYQTMGLNISLPVIPGDPLHSPPPLLGLNSLDATIKRAHSWVASSRLAAQLGDWYVFAGAEAALPRQVTAEFDQHPMGRVSGLTDPIHMKGADFRWWMWEVGTGYTAYDRVIVFSAVRRDLASLRLGEPSEFGMPQLQNVADFVGADLQTSLWIPHLGVNFSGARYSASLAWSPLAVVQVKLPFRMLSAGQGRGETATYVVNNPGNFIEVKFDSDMKIMRTFDLGIWVKGTWLQVRGIGTEDVRTLSSGSTTGEFGTGSAESVITRYQASVGLTAAAAF